MNFVLLAAIILINVCGPGVLSDRWSGIISPENPVRSAHNARQESNSLGPYLRPNHQPFPTNNTKGQTFDRFVQIWLWNEDYESAAKDPSLQWLAKQGITLTNYHALSHTRLQNYIGSVGGQPYRKVHGDEEIPEDRKTIADLMEAKNIRWATYEDNFYHNWKEKELPFGNFKSYTDKYTSHHKQTLERDFFWALKDNRLPQWMFMDLNFKDNDGQPHRMEMEGLQTKTFVEKLLQNGHFMNRTLLLITFDRPKHKTSGHRVFSILLGDALSHSDRGKKDNTRYDHYSIMATVERNWSLGSLGLNDKRAKPFF